MNAGGGALVETATEQLRADHGLAEATHEDRAWRQVKERYGVSYTQGFRAGWWDAVEWLLARQHDWDALTPAEHVAELRKGSGSIFHPLFAADSVVFADCPNDGRVPITKSGTCDHCLYNFEGR